MSAASPPREKKRSFAQAELEEVSPGQETMEDDLRRNQGPPKASTGARPGGTTGVELQSTDRIYQPHDEGHELGGEAPVPNPEASKPVPPAENPPGDLQEATTGLPDVGHCLVLPLVKVIKAYHVKLGWLMPLL